MERKLAGGSIRGGGREERCRGYKRASKGQHENGCIGSEGMRRLVAGGRVSGGWLGQGGHMGQDTKRALSNASRHWHASQRPDALEVAISLPDRMSLGRRTQNRSLSYKRLERPAHRVSGE